LAFCTFTKTQADSLDVTFLYYSFVFGLLVLHFTLVFTESDLITIPFDGGDDRGKPALCSHLMEAHGNCGFFDNVIGQGMTV
jgi:hypothetical protein